MTRCNPRSRSRNIINFARDLSCKSRAIEPELGRTTLVSQQGMGVDIQRLRDALDVVD